MNIVPVNTEESYRNALHTIETLMDADYGTENGAYLDILVTLVEAYENKHYPLDLPDPVAALQFHMEHKGLSPKDLQPMIGRRNRVSEILNRKRALTLPMIRKLHSELGIPVESLIRATPITVSHHAQ